jgi:hypothetical protein
VNDLQARIIELETETAQLKADLSAAKEKLREIEEWAFAHTDAYYGELRGLSDDLSEVIEYVMPLVRKAYPDTRKPLEEFLASDLSP